MVEGTVGAENMKLMLAEVAKAEKAGDQKAVPKKKK